MFFNGDLHGPMTQDGAALGIRRKPDGHAIGTTGYSPNPIEPDAIYVSCPPAEEPRGVATIFEEVMDHPIVQDRMQYESVHEIQSLLYSFDEAAKSPVVSLDAITDEYRGQMKNKALNLGKLSVDFSSDHDIRL